MQTLVDVPAVSPFTTYLGFVSYDIYELRIYGNGYELWNTQTSTTLGTQIMPTAGRHNIGIRAGVNGGVWVDGAQLTLPGLILTNNVPVNVGFGTHGIGGDLANGLVLLENLNYIRSYNRADPDEQAPTLGTPRITVTNFDGPRPVTVWEPISDDLGIQTLKAVNYTEDATRADHNHGGVEGTELYLPNGRRTTGLVITPSSDQVTYADGQRTVIEDPLPGVKWANHVDAVGCIQPLSRQDLLGPVTPWFNADTVTFVGEGIYGVANQTEYLGAGRPEGPSPTIYMSGATEFGDAPVCEDLGAGLARETINCSDGDCLIRGSNASMPKTAATIGTVTGTVDEWTSGGSPDLKHGIKLSGGLIDFSKLDDIAKGQKMSMGPGMGIQDEILEKCSKMGGGGGTTTSSSSSFPGGGGWSTSGFGRPPAAAPSPTIVGSPPGPTTSTPSPWGPPGSIPIPVQGPGGVGGSTGDPYINPEDWKIRGATPRSSTTSTPAQPKTAKETSNELWSKRKQHLAEAIVAEEYGEHEKANFHRAAAQQYKTAAEAWDKANGTGYKDPIDEFFKEHAQPKTAGDAGGGKPPKPPVNTAAPTPFGEDHHIGTNKGHWKTRFKALFKTANMTLEDEDNKVWLEDHCGRHTEWYHNYVYRRLERAIGTRTGAEAEAALRAELRLIREQLLANPRLPYSHRD